MIQVDALQNKTSLDSLPLDWVGMGAISSVVRVFDGTKELNLPVIIHAFVNLISDSRGIHMSRIYKELQDFSANKEFSFLQLKELSARVLQSQGAISDSVKLQFEMQLPLQQRTLKSQQEYQKTYPLKVKVLKSKIAEEVSINFQIDYSSTCPQSAALSREIIMKNLKSKDWSSVDQLVTYIQDQGLMATPHAQRSVLDLHVTWAFESLDSNIAFIDFVGDFIAQIESVLGTPTQGVVKRADEQEFAVLNAKNLMFCEDAARKVKSFLKAQKKIKSYAGKVTHIESLHSHDAVAEFSSFGTTI